MEIHSRRNRVIQEQENKYGVKGKINAIPKAEGTTVRGALGELATNIQAQRDVCVGKVTFSAAECEKKSLKCNTKSNYSHVQSKIDTGLAGKNIIQPSSRPPLRREESTGGLATRAALQTKAAAKLALKKPNETKEPNFVVLNDKKLNKEVKKTKLKVIKEIPKEHNLKPILKDSTKSLGKLKLTESSDTKVSKTTEIYIDSLVKSPPPLPDDIEDIDAGDNNPLLVSVYIKDIYKYLTELECKYPVEENHLKNQNVITGNMRATLIDWLVELQCQFTLILETFHLTVGIIDHYLQVVPNVPKEKLQLIGVTAMFIASKYEEIYAPDVNDFVFVTDYTYSKSDILRCEKEILQKLGFCLAWPIPLNFLRRFVKVAHGTSKNHHLAKYFVDLCLVDYSMAHYRPSELSAAAICLSLYILSNERLEDVWTPTLSYYSGYKLDHIEPIIRKIAKIVTNTERSKFKAVFNKYMDVTLAKVSCLPQLKSETMYELAQRA
ncbi:G2/mitotic-specific cyclin-B1 [Colias croceus]|uniref:G2/mitotic-specific cyclin-B1 n=1 Tax=Colias crocea TaxID=72248 RepID=UPI001E27DB04|nr:G2/mitotic-specific cyclin-B1 [Colias croceus]